MGMNILKSFFAFALLTIFLTVAGCPGATNPVASNPGPTPTPCTGVFGNNSPSATTAGTGNIFFSPFYLATPTTLNSLAVSIASGGTQHELGVYSEASGGPSTLIVETGARPVTGMGWHSTSLNSGVFLSAGSNYWLAVFTDGTFGSTFDGGMGSHAVQSWSTFGSLPSAFTGSVVQHMTMMCMLPPCPPNIPMPMPMPGLLVSVWGRTCP